MRMVESGNERSASLDARNEKRAGIIMEATAPIVNDSARTLEARQAASNANVFGFSAWALYQRGRPANADTFLAFAEQWLTLLIRPEAELGAKFIEGCKKPRRDALAKLMDDALAEMPPEATAMDVLAKVAKIDGGRKVKDRVIQEIDRDNPEAPVVVWRAKGREKTTTFKSFQNRLTKRRKIIA